ncbi:hypothetical protein JYG23_07080 [Sedimentibacter sp. zth1]|uniref:glycosyl hydrolase family 18 protein n=1 Tax=Sedimentibacter sp. zth1 TaxID=2816908 RepID=UPI001A925368|nr:glycosyl hydrolase family 18 protein [Sedimentibacter sp. zth1]QSX07099.1 hypothetical protein JYG23_07080 [Sedimentibacter sp. zth1]
MRKSKIFILIVLSILIILGVVFIINSINDNEIIQQANLYIENGIYNYDDLLLSDDKMYISMDCIKANDLLDLHWDKDYNKLSIFKNYNNITISYNNDNATYIDCLYLTEDVLKVFNDTLYLNATFLKNNLINSMFVDNNSKNIIISNIEKQYRAKIKTSLKFWTSSDNSEEYTIKRNDIFYIYDKQISNMLLCRNTNGNIGYVLKKNIVPYITIEETTYTKPHRKESITMSWDLVNKKISNFVEFDIPQVIDVLAPTWYELVDNEDYFLDYSNVEYTSYVQSTGKKLWATFNNNFDKELTSKLLNNAYKRSKIVDKVIQITKEKGYNGINIDFENVYLKDKDVYSAFIKELYCKCLTEKITLSVDVAVLSSSETWSMFLDRKAIGEYSDYVVLMAYDQNVSGVSGSVGSIPWIEYGVENLLESVNDGKVILAVPFYTRLWEESMEDDALVVKSTSLKISTAEKLLDELGIELSYDVTTGQNYGEKMIDGVRCRVWNEDETSLSNRMEIVKKYNLVGKGVWAFNFGTEEMWQSLE